MGTADQSDVLVEQDGHYEAPLSPKTPDGALEEGAIHRNVPATFMAHATVMLKWENVTYDVQVKNSATKKMETKNVLKNMSGYAKPGELLVIMGPSGAGKTSLLNVISGRNKSYNGKVTLNGLPWSRNMRKLSSYVKQDDMFFGELTVFEHLTFQAELRMDASISKEYRITAVKQVMEELNLTKVKDSMIGTPGTLRGISGGERKRLAIASEILVDPSIMFVDEPTSGLDSFMAEQVVQQLYDLAQGNRTIIATIHQPSSDVFNLFDRLLLVADGRVAFFGKSADAVSYFSSIGYSCPSYNNPADYFMKQLSIISTEVDESKKRVKQICDEYDSRSAQAAEAKAQDLTGLSDAGEIGKFLEDPRTMQAYKASFQKQMVELTKRTVKVTIRNPLSFKAKIFQALFLGVLVGLIFLRVDNNERGVQNFNGALFFIVVNQAFSNTIPVVQSFPAILPLFLREHQAGMYSVGAFFTALTTSDIPFQILWPVLFGTVSYWLIGFSNDFGNFLIFLVIIVLISNTAISLAYMISCVAPSVEIALVMAPLIILPFMLFGGFFVNEDSIPVYFYWLSYISFVRYGFHAAAVNQWKNFGDIPCTGSGGPCYADGQAVLDSLSIDTSIIMNIGVLIGMMIGLRVLAFVFLYIRTRRAEKTIT